jgi:protein-tyrosine phosphatase
LFVCTGNVCRSPAAAALLTARGADRFHVATAGTRALVDAPPHRNIVRALGELDVPVTSRGKQVTDEMVRSADLVLGLEVVHRDVIGRRVPEAWERIFTLREYVSLLRQLGRPAQVDEVDRCRRERGLPAGESLDVDDPFGKRLYRPYRRCVRTLDELVRELAQRAAPTDSGSDTASR